jgi:hypothetical protein
LDEPTSYVLTSGGILKKERFFKRVAGKILFKRKWLRISEKSNKGDWRAILKSAEKNNLPAIEFMIHSSELFLGGSRLTKTEKSVEFVFEKLEEMFLFYQTAGLRGIGLSNFANQFKQCK